jgi:hypothetical protein
MEPNLNQERQQAHALLDMLPAEKLNAVRSLLEVMVEPLARSLAVAPVEEDEITPETAAALDRARASLARGEGIPHEEILREFGLRRLARKPRQNGSRWSGRRRRAPICAQSTAKPRYRFFTAWIDIWLAAPAT